MRNIVNLLFEAKMLKDLPRSGYSFLGSGHETVAEHSFMITFIAFVISKTETDIDPLRLIQMCLLHDLPEARTGDQNYVHKKYSTTDEDKAVNDIAETVPFGDAIKSLIDEFNLCSTKEARLAKDADQLSFLLELKHLQDTGRKGPEKMDTNCNKPVNDPHRKKIADEILKTPWDEWWQKNYVD